MFEKYLIQHCSPTLASLKTAALFSIPCPDKAILYRDIVEWNRKLSSKGISLLILRESDGKALIYVCRMSQLSADLRRQGVADFLRSYGYKSTNAVYALIHLRLRLSESKDFPHEIGIFLGYPLGDVTGFIENKGKNSKYCGCWKVYCNECETVKRFDEFDKCKSVYMRQWNDGFSVRQLTAKG